MTNTSSLFILNMPGLVFLIIYMSCNAPTVTSDKNEQESDVVKQISHITYGTDPDAEKWYEYNENGDLSRQSAFIDTIIFTYEGNQIIKRYLDKNSNWQAKIVYHTDTSGKVISSNIYDEDDNEISRYKFEYNAEGYLAKTIQDVLTSGATYVNEFIYENGNLKEVLAYNNQGQYSSKYAFEYYSDLAYVFNINVNQIMDDNFPNERLGKMNKNMIMQMANVSKEGDTLSLVKYRYDPVTNGKLKEFQSDVLNEFDTELIYHFVNKK
jgi:hypothetical protein